MGEEEHADQNADRTEIEGARRRRRQGQAEQDNQGKEPQSRRRLKQEAEQDDQGQER